MPALIKFSDLVAAGKILTVPAVGDLIVIDDISEPLDTNKTKVIAYSDLVNLAAQAAVQKIINDQAAGDMFYASSATALARLAKSTAKKVLAMNAAATAPEWSKLLFGAKVNRSTNQTLANNTDTAMIFNTEEYDDDGYWVVGAPTRFTITDTGKYLMGANVQFDGGAAARALGIYKNGTTWIAKNYSPNPESVMSISVLALLTAGEYIEAIVNQVSLGNLDILGAAHAGILNMWIIRIN